MKKYKSEGKALEVTVNNKEENSSDFCLDLIKEFGLWSLPVYNSVLEEYVSLCINTTEPSDRDNIPLC